MADGPLKVGLIGYGYWGSKLARVLRQLGALVAICDTDQARLQAVMEAHLPASVWQDLPSFYANSTLDRVVIATPPETHYALAKEALARGLGVFVEKPLATTYQQAKELEDLARSKNLPLMVGHIYLHCPGIEMMERPAGQATLYIKFLNPQGPPSPTGENILWAALPHALSLALHFFPCLPLEGKDSLLLTYRAGHTDHRLQTRLDYWDGSQVFIDVGNHTGQMVRQVELRVGNTRYCFTNSSSHILTLRSGVEMRQELVRAEEPVEPLVREMRTFLRTREVDPLGAQVVKLLTWLESRLASKPA